MKRKFLVFFAILICIAASSTVLTGCLSDAEKEVVGKYELTELSVAEYPGFNASIFTYSLMKFNADRTCKIISKAGTTEYEAEATWKVNSNGEIEVISYENSTKITEKYKYEDGYITGTYSTIIDGITITMTVTFKKIIE